MSAGGHREGIRSRLTEPDGTFYMPAMAALVRLALDQARRDRSAGLHTGTFITGYPGSPLAGYDLALEREPALLRELDIVHSPAGSEERAATALMGTQMLDLHPHSRYDGVVGWWYGKGPGVDRAGDALRHGNFAGTSRHGAVLVLSGEDHEAKSSTMPFQEDYAFASAGIPVLYPSSVAEMHLLGLHAVALSRLSGCWVALKLVTGLCDGGERVSLSPGEPEIVLPEVVIEGQPFAKRADFTFFPGRNVDVERHLFRERHAAVLAYASANALDRVTLAGDHDRLGLISAGKSWADLSQALADLGLDEVALGRAGIRLLKLGLTYPIDAGAVRSFADGLDQVIVVEEKRGFVEAQVKEAIADLGRPVRVIGKHDESGRPLLPIEGGLDADRLVELLGPRLVPLAGDRAAPPRLAVLADVRRRRYPALSGRTPNYCSGCPHSTSTRLPEGAIAWGSPGCHSFASVMEQPERHIEAMTQYGGEGLPWIGLSPFTDRTHMFQNVGDGSLFHSSYENIRSCVAAGVNITFKVLFNQAVANTGAQAPVGGRSVAELCRLLDIEGVKRVALVTKDPDSYRKAGLPPTTTVHPASQVVTVQGELAATPGVTVMVYDESCANERRRRQRRGRAARPSRYVMVNERVCEDCGDCGRVSNCMSLQKAQTPFGPKTRIHASSCNQDYSCLQGDCPSFVTVETADATGYRRPEPAALDAGALPEPHPAPLSGQPYRIHAPGVGGTGVITANAILAVAAVLDGLEVRTYDQTGAAQKWGPVVSSISVSEPGVALHSNRVGAASADLLLAFDLVAASGPDNLDRCDPERTAAVVNTTLFPTGEMVRDLHAVPDVEAMLGAIGAWSDPARSLGVPARQIAEGLFGDYMMTNLLLVGAAYQGGLVPISARSIEAAISLNGVAVAANVAAFRYGRLWVADHEAVEAAIEEADPAAQVARAAGPGAGGHRAAGAERRAERLLAGGGGLDPETLRILRPRVADLVGYQDASYARSYLETVVRVASREAEVLGERRDITRALARNLHKLMAYKDEYEVARLYLDPAFTEAVHSTFESPRQVRYHLHPPLLRSLGMGSKVELGPWFRPAFHVLRSMKALRGTPADPFGRSALRRQERELPGWYRGVMTEALNRLRPSNAPTVLALAELPDRVRGYEDIKLRSISAARAEADRLLARLDRTSLPLVSTV